MKTNKTILSFAIATLLCGNMYAAKDIGSHKPTSTKRVLATGCVQDQGAEFISINNVRARIMDEGDMWWDPSTNLQQYFEPAAGNVCPEFAGALWIAGLDAGGQLKVAAMTYRQNGEDFWTGPLDTATVSITPSECQAYDKLFYVTRQEVQNFVAHPGNPAYLTSDIKNWPGNGDQSKGEAKFLAPFIDKVGDGVYNPAAGDYPGYDLTGKNDSCKDEIYGDATLWWVINDEGNVHSESGGLPIGLEIRCQAFSFKTNDAINNCTFYNYEVINRSSYQMNKTYFGFWNDFDLGNGANDFTGCDVTRSFGYGYNGTNSDPDGSGNFGGEHGYHSDLPAIGVVFFQGPFADKGDANCYIHNGRIGLARFVYYNNDFSNRGNPINATSYYNYLRGIWIDGTPMTYGGDGYQSSTTPCSYMFPWTPLNASTNVNTDLSNCGTAGIPQSPWNEVTAGDVPYDRRFIESAGPFTLKPGAKNYVTTGVVFDQTSVLNNQYLSIPMIQQDADLAQALFNNCFKVLDGPDAPDLTLQELNHEVIITLTNSTTSNNYKEHYAQRSPTIVPPYKDTMYVFEGYEIFQLLDSSVTATQLLDPTKARLVAECDVQNGVTQLVNYTLNSSGINQGTVEVTGQDKGIVHSFDIKVDQFQEDGSTGLVNDRPYYFMAIAYAYNNYTTYNPNGPDSLLKGQKLPFLQGRNNTKVYTAIPHIVTAQDNGTIQNSGYGEGPAITRIEGHGNGSNVIALDDASISYILQHDSMAHCSYLPGQGPISVKIVDPLSVPNNNFVVKFSPGKAGGPMDSTARWKVYIQGGSDTVYSDTDIAYQYEQIIPQWGISISIKDVDVIKWSPPLPNLVPVLNILLDSACTMTFSDPSKDWLTGVRSVSPGVDPRFWIRCGEFQDKVTPDGGFNSDVACPSCNPVTYLDINCNYSGVLGGTWAPYPLCAMSSTNLSCDNGPKWGGPFNYSTMTTLSSVDIVITSDRSKWTRCPVLEEQDQAALAQGGATKMAPRNAPSIALDQATYAANGASASSDPNDPAYIWPTGMGWFPGYAINVETGERLNMAFGEDSWLIEHNGRDMKWNPDSTVFKQNASAFFGASSVFGGKHYIYVFGHNNNPNSIVPIYDDGQVIMNTLVSGVTKNIAKVFGDCMWVNIPLLKAGHQLMESDVTIHLRVSKPYATNWAPNWSSASPDNNNYPMYSFSTNGLQVETNNESAAKSALNLINIVPNPYYGYSSYESGRIDTRVRITNLPPTCTISIFSLNGTLVKVINKENPDTYIDWNLQNQFNVPIASGLYIIHVAVPNVGEKTLKWFGVLRPLDLNSY